MPLPGVFILRHVGDGLVDPFAAAQALLRLPVCSLVPVARLRQSKERVEKCAGVAQQHLVRCSIEFRFFGRTIDADQCHTMPERAANCRNSSDYPNGRLP